MNIFVKSTKAPKPKTPNIRILGAGLAFLYAVMAVTQLASMKSFLEVIYSINIVSVSGAAIVAGVVIALEIVAIPFLLGLRLSPLMRMFSMFSGFVVLLIWLVLSTFEVMGGSASTLGLFGGNILLVPGWWVSWYLIGLMIVQAWVCWGWWPNDFAKISESVRSKKTKKTKKVKK